MFTEIFGPLIGLKEEWAAQGAAPDELDLWAFRFRFPEETRLPVNTGWLDGDEEVISEDTPKRLVYRDRMGRRMEMAKTVATLALPTTHPVETMDDWLRIKHHYEFAESRIGACQPAPGKVTTISIPGGFDEPRQLMGEENLVLEPFVNIGRA